MTGIQHNRPDGTECRYLAATFCNKCGWTEPVRDATTAPATSPAGVTRWRPAMEVEARRFDPGADYDEACSAVAWCGGRTTDDGCEINVPWRGWITARPGDWIVKGEAGDFWPMTPEIFAMTYKPAGGGEASPPVAEPGHVLVSRKDLRMTLKFLACYVPLEMRGADWAAVERLADLSAAAETTP